MFRFSISVLFIAAIVPFGSLAASERMSDIPELEHASIRLRQISGPEQGMFYGIKWSREGRVCQALQGFPDQREQWLGVSPRACKRLRAYILGHFSELKAEKLPSRYDYHGSRSGMAYLGAASNEASGFALGAPMHGKVTSRVQGLVGRVRLGRELRDRINYEIGKLHDWVPPPEIAVWGDWTATGRLTLRRRRLNGFQPYPRKHHLKAGLRDVLPELSAAACRRAIWSTIRRPSPVPSGLEDQSWAKSLERCSGKIPGPLSRTSMR